MTGGFLLFLPPSLLLFFSLENVLFSQGWLTPKRGIIIVTCVWWKGDVGRRWEGRGVLLLSGWVGASADTSKLQRLDGIGLF